MTPLTPLTMDPIEDLYRFGLKLFVEPGVSVDDGLCIPIFHRWIQDAALDRLLIDVADYSHLAAGPSVLLVGHEGNLSVDRAGGRSGIVCTSKRPAVGSLPERIVNVTRVLLTAAQLLESDPVCEGQLRFVPNELQFQANDRLLAPPGDDSVASLTPPLLAVMETLYPDQPHQIDSASSSGDRLKIGLRTSEAVSLRSLLDRVPQTVQNA